MNKSHGTKKMEEYGSEKMSKQKNSMQGIRPMHATSKVASSKYHPSLSKPIGRDHNK